jgi:dTDP-4-amino-4,6-dideoxy-D-galactose acyltransferase
MIERLEWDSSFFGYPVGQVFAIPQVIINEKELEKAAKEYKLVYIRSDRKIDFTPGRLFLADTKTRFIKNITERKEGMNNKQFFSVEAVSDKLNSLVLQSGEYSRFRNDPHFVNNEFERLYIKWLHESIDKIVADKVVEVKESDGCKGFVSIKLFENYSEIGLIAVDAASRGRGLGISLLDYVNNYTMDKGIFETRVTTQFQNLPAMNLYEKAGYKISSREYIYHLWN